jgi:hypothetical protein
MKNIYMIPSISIALLILISILVIVVYHNTESRNIVFAFSAVVGTIFMFYMNVYFELEDTNENYVINTELSIFHDRPEVAQRIYPVSSNYRMHIDLNASEWLANNKPKLFKENSQKVMHDLIMYSLVGFLISEENDYKKTTKAFSRMRFTSFRIKPEEKGKDTFIPIKQFSQLLQDNGNIFAPVPFKVITQGIFLPPKSKLELKQDELIIENPFSTIHFIIEDSGSGWYGTPGSNIAHAELLEDGSHKYESRYFNIDIKVTYKGQRAKNKLMPEYKTWIENLAYDTKKWFSITNEDSTTP